MRWFFIQNDETIWGAGSEALLEKDPNCLPKSVSFIASTVHDNKILLEKDPGYLANLKALPRFEREELLMVNWNVSPTAGMFFQRSFFEVVKAIPKGGTKAVRYWDRAATKRTETNDPDYTVGLRLERDKNNILYVTDMVRIQQSLVGVQTAIKNTASQDGIGVRIGIEQDSGQAGVSEADYLVRMLQGYTIKTFKATQDKVTRALLLFLHRRQASYIKILQAPWNEDFLRELENFPEGSHDDIVDALGGAFFMLDDSTYDLSGITTF